MGCVINIRHTQPVASQLSVNCLDGGFLVSYAAIPEVPIHSLHVAMMHVDH